MAGKETKERALNIQEGDGEVIDLGLFDFKETTEEEETTKQPKQKPEVLVTVIKKINLKNEEEIHGLFYTSNDEDDEIEEEAEIEEKNERKSMIILKNEIEEKMHGGEVKEMAAEEKDTSVEIERVTIEETMWPEKMKGSIRERNEKKGFLKKIIEKWT